MLTRLCCSALEKLEAELQGRIEFDVEAPCSGRCKPGPDLGNSLMLYHLLDLKGEAGTVEPIEVLRLPKIPEFGVALSARGLLLPSLASKALESSSPRKSIRVAVLKLKTLIV